MVLLVSWFDFFSQFLIELIAIATFVNSPVTVRTEGDNVLWIIRTTIASTCKVMNLEERLTALIHEGCIFFAALANTVGHSKCELPDEFRSGIRTTAT